MQKTAESVKLWRVLVVEDEALIAEEIQDRLVRMGCQVAGVADTGAAALELAGETLPDLVLMDVQLKGPMDGIDTAREIFRRFDIPVVFLTAHSDQSTFQRTQTEGTFGYLLKPFHARDLSVAMAMAVSRFRMDRRVKESEHAHAAIVDSIADAAVVTDVEGRIRSMNPAAEALTGWIAGESVGRPIEQVLSITVESTGIRIENPAAWALRTNSVVVLTGPLVLFNRHGTGIPVEGNAAPMVDPAGKVTGAVVVLRDTTERRRLEQDLWQAQKMQALGQMAGGVAHDFNNLLTVINGFGNLLFDKLAGQPELRNQADQICKAGAIAAAITDQLLAFSQKRMLQSEVLDLNRIIEDSRPFLKQLLGDRIAVEIDLASDLHSVLATVASIQQVLMNLATNARDAMPEGGSLRIETSNTSGQGAGRASPAAYVRLRVRDSGHGIPAAALSKIFEPFFTTKQAGEGTGLGLATVYGIVKQRGGWIDVASEPGQGATFDVYLPAAHGSVPERSTAEAAQSGSLAITILLAEDEAGVRDLCASVLQSNGSVVLPARDGAKALEVARQFAGKIDLLVSDIAMPHLSGPQLFEQLKRSGRNLPVLFISGYPNEALPSGSGVELLAKPFVAGELMAAVARTLKMAANARE